MGSISSFLYLFTSLPQILLLFLLPSGFYCVLNSNFSFFGYRKTD